MRELPVQRSLSLASFCLGVGHSRHRAQPASLRLTMLPFPASSFAGVCRACATFSCVLTTAGPPETSPTFPRPSKSCVIEPAEDAPDFLLERDEKRHRLCLFFGGEGVLLREPSGRLFYIVL